MAQNGVAANLLLLFIVTLGLMSLPRLSRKRSRSSPSIRSRSLYPGATPQVEALIVTRIEEQVSALEVVKQVTSVVAEGLASVVVELRTGADIDRALRGVEAAVGQIQTFPGGAESPLVRQMTNRRSVMRLVLFGDVSERSLEEPAYRVEDELAALPAVSFVETSGVRQYETSIEVPHRRLRALGLTLDDVAAAVRAGSMDLSAGNNETLQDFEAIAVLSRRRDPRPAGRHCRRARRVREGRPDQPLQWPARRLLRRRSAARKTRPEDVGVYVRLPEAERNARGCRD